MERLIAEPYSPELRATFLNNDPDAYYVANAYPWPGVTEKLSAIDKPTLLICGEKADELNDIKLACTLIPKAEIKVIPGYDHAQTYRYAKKIVPLI